MINIFSLKHWLIYAVVVGISGSVTAGLTLLKWNMMLFQFTKLNFNLEQTINREKYINKKYNSTLKFKQSIWISSISKASSFTKVTQNNMLLKKRCKNLGSSNGKSFSTRLRPMTLSHQIFICFILRNIFWVTKYLVFFTVYV